jgi:uncharacterized protein YyaL (SSP411 family)
MTTLFFSCQTEKQPTQVTEEHQFTNDLIHESSPYLLQHAHNPVDWKPWKQEVLDLAKAEDKMLLISIGYSSCHWCHVMEKESFENEEVAQIMNDHFICIKVDREERPDIDDIYMGAVQQITGRGGWPLNCFALPDGSPFHGGTYFPKENWKRVLLTVAYEFDQNRDKLEEFAEKLKHNMSQEKLPLHEEEFSDQTNRNILDSTVSKWSSTFDNTFGGANKAPKFPLPNNYEFLLDYAISTNNDALHKHVDITLKAMARGGIYDQLVGGFARYSVDGLWKVPHFEKMLYDNGQLLEVYSKAYRYTKNPEYLDVINQTCQWLFDEMYDESGAFYAALDADSEGEEGKFYVWSPEELKDVLGEDYDWFTSYFPVEEKGKWEGNYILVRNQSKVEFAESKNWTVEELNNKLDNAFAKLNQVRNKRIRPGLDDKCLTSWNGLLISGLCEAYKATKDEEILKKAVGIGDWLVKKQMNQDHELKHTYKNEESSIDGFLEDYAFAASGCIRLYEVTGDVQWMETARDLCGKALKLFKVDDDVLFATTRKEQKDVLIRKVGYYDNVIPSANSEMCLVLKHVGIFFDISDWEERSQKMLDRVKPFVNSYGSGFSNWLQALHAEVQGAKELVITGPNAEEVVKDYWNDYRPLVDVYYSKTVQENLLFKGRFTEGETQIFLCVNKACMLPVKQLEDVNW